MRTIQKDAICAGDETLSSSNIHIDFSPADGSLFELPFPKAILVVSFACGEPIEHVDR